jgi:hypothetical protein
MKRSITSLFVAFALLVSISANAQIEKHQATFIYNFTRLVQWPELYKESSFVIGVMGSNQAITRELKEGMGERTVAGKNIEIVEFSSAAELGKCHLLFIPNRYLGQLDKVVDAIGKNPVLLVTENQGRHPGGSAINFAVEDGKLGITLDEEITQNRNLLVSRQLANFSR